MSYQNKCLKKSKCDNCNIDKHLEVFQNPYCMTRPLTLCQKCSEVPFCDFHNKEILKPSFEHTNIVKSFGASTGIPQALENFKISLIYNESSLAYATAGFND
jgi:hypothetical protein